MTEGDKGLLAENAIFSALTDSFLTEGEANVLGLLAEGVNILPAPGDLSSLTKVCRLLSEGGEAGVDFAGVSLSGGVIGVDLASVTPSD